MFLLLSGNSAFAHSSLPGVQGLYWGMLHPFTLGPQILMLCALSFFIQQRLPESENSFNGLCIGCLIGAAAAASGLVGSDPDMAMTLCAIALGIVVASAVKVARSLLWVAGGAAGVLSGLAAWPDPGPLSDMLYSGAGAIIGSIVIVILVAGSAELFWLKTGWAWIKVAVRVAGSWITAIAVLLGALLLRASA